MKQSTILESSSYLGNPLLKPAGTESLFTKDQVEEYIKCLQDPIYFIEKYIKISNVDKGLCPLELYPIQKSFLQLLIANPKTITRASRQSGKGIIPLAFILHSILFKNCQVVGLFSFRKEWSCHLLSLLKNRYQQIPYWMQKGVVNWNKNYIELEDGSKVISCSLNISGVIGTAFSIIFLDELAFCSKESTNSFFEYMYPRTVWDKNLRIIIASSTNKKDNMFYKLWKDANECRNEFIPFSIFWYDIPGRNQKWKEECIKNTSQENFEREFECKFI